MQSQGFHEYYENASAVELYVYWNTEDAVSSWAIHG